MLRIDQEALWADLQALAQIGATEAGGVTRLGYTAADLAGRDWVAAKMRALGMQVRVDAAGNLIGRLPGREDLPAIAMGSHTDTVPNGGRFDGALGVVAALHAVEALQARGQTLRHPVEVISFACEEAVYGGGTLGSLAMVGRWDPAILTRPVPGGGTLRERITAAHLDPDAMATAARAPGELAAFLELHIEQGQVLEHRGTTIGLVEGIVGINRYAVTFTGQANHAGTTPMEIRDDALVKAAEYTLAVRDLGASRPATVATVGQLQVAPGAPTVIPGQVDLSIDLRSLDVQTLAELEGELERRALVLGGSFRSTSRKPPVRSSPALLAALQAGCERSGLDYHYMPSGAGHDAMCMAFICPVAMIFVPSKGGRSHSPVEWTDPAHCAAGAELLVAALSHLDQSL